MYFWKARVGQIDNSRTDKLMIRLEVKVATQNTLVGVIEMTHNQGAHGLSTKKI